MTKPETKVVLGRVFMWHEFHEEWFCPTKHGVLTLCGGGASWCWEAGLERGDDEYVIATATGPTEADAILALQSQLRKMAELEVVE